MWYPSVVQSDTTSNTLTTLYIQFLRCTSIPADTHRILVAYTTALVETLEKGFLNVAEKAAIFSLLLQSAGRRSAVDTSHQCVSRGGVLGSPSERTLLRLPFMSSVRCISPDTRFAREISLLTIPSYSHRSWMGIFINLSVNKHNPLLWLESGHKRPKYQWTQKTDELKKNVNGWFGPDVVSIIIARNRGLNEHYVGRIYGCAA